jgi:hypothetical protein
MKAEAVVNKSRYYSIIFREGLRKPTKSFSHNSRCSRRIFEPRTYQIQVYIVKYMSLIFCVALYAVFIIFGQWGSNDKIVSNQNLWFIENKHTDTQKLVMSNRSHKNICEEPQKSDCTKQQPTNKRPVQSTWNRKKTQQNVARGSH